MSQIYYAIEVNGVIITPFCRTLTRAWQLSEENYPMNFPPDFWTRNLSSGWLGGWFMAGEEVNVITTSLDVVPR